jgi:WD40 repeat protein
MQDVRDMAFSPDDKYLELAYESYTGIQNWDIVNNQNVYSYLRNPLGSYLSIATSYNGLYVCAGTNKRLYLYKSYWSKVSVPDNSILATVIYPNPNINVFNLEFDLNKDNFTAIDLIDLTGNSIKSIYNGFLNIGHHQYTINISDLPAGAYILRINSGNFSCSNQIIKQ